MSTAQTIGEADEDDQRPLIVTLISRSPWWAVSAVFHLLVVALISLAMIGVRPNDAATSCELVYSSFSKPLDDVTDSNAVLAANHVTLSTDGSSKEATDIVVPPDIISKAVLSDHFETINSDRPDTHSACGASDSTLFHRTSGSEESAGGGVHESAFVDVDIGTGGIGPGAGSGWGGGYGAGTGIDSGSSSGSFGSLTGFGRRLMVKRHGCGSRCDEACGAALAWLAKHQEFDGHWDAKKNGADFKTDTAVTALALLSFLGEGHTERIGQYKSNVQRAVAWLISQQNAGGLIFDRSDAGEFRGCGYPHAIATLALAESYGMSGPRARTMQAAAQKAVDSCMKSQSPSGGWRYKPGVEADLSVTGWYVMALKSAKMAHLQFDPEVWPTICKFLDSVEIKGDASQSFTPSSQYSYQPGSANHAAPHRIAAVGNLARYFTGTQSTELLSSVQWFIQKGGVPQWGADGESVDLYYWYYGTVCAFEVGGDEWTAWEMALRSALIEHQCKDGDHAGSWPIAGVYSREWGRVGQTALAALCLGLYQGRYYTLRSK